MNRRKTILIGAVILAMMVVCWQLGRRGSDRDSSPSTAGTDSGAGGSTPGTPEMQSEEARQAFILTFQKWAAATISQVTQRDASVREVLDLGEGIACALQLDSSLGELTELTQIAVKLRGTLLEAGARESLVSVEPTLRGVNVSAPVRFGEKAGLVTFGLFDNDSTVTAQYAPLPVSIADTLPVAATP